MTMDCRIMTRFFPFLRIGHDVDIGHAAIGEIPFENYLRINNTDITAAQAAAYIKDKFNL